MALQVIMKRLQEKTEVLKSMQNKESHSHYCLAHKLKLLEKDVVSNFKKRELSKTIILK